MSQSWTGRSNSVYAECQASGDESLASQSDPSMLNSGKAIS